MVIPEQVHNNKAKEACVKRSQFLGAYDKYSNRFENRVPKPHNLPTEVEIKYPK